MTRYRTFAAAALLALMTACAAPDRHPEREPGPITRIGDQIRRDAVRDLTRSTQRQIPRTGSTTVDRAARTTTILMGREINDQFDRDRGSGR